MADRVFCKAEGLRHLDGQTVGPYRLRIASLVPLRRSGWSGFALAAATAQDHAPPVAEGIHSTGGRGVPPWIELTRFRPDTGFPHADAATRQALSQALLSLVGAVIPPGGHLMVACDGDDTEATYRQLMKNVPPSATPLGSALVRAGFPRVKFFYIAEGGWEGSQKLWAERPPDAATTQAWRRATVNELERFLSRRHDDPVARDNVRALLAELKGSGSGDRSSC